MEQEYFKDHFDKEEKFEEALIELLTSRYGWGKTVLKQPTEQDLLDNWARIIYQNNSGIDRLGDYPLTRSEMMQVVDQINRLRTPLLLNDFINGKTISIKRDNPADVRHLGHEVSLFIYDAREISSGHSVYQIAEQPVLPTADPLRHDRRGDLMLLVNGMPFFHIELKKSGVPVMQACNQIEKYAHERIFAQGIFALVQVFVAMTPTETLYFANPGPDGKFNRDYYFHWADFNNEPVNEWFLIASGLLSIPMAHQLVGYYTVADGTDGVLKVMRSYQYFAASNIAEVVSHNLWADRNQRGGYVWHTTGSGKTMTSFKSAQLIARSDDADKVIFLVDRIELGTQSLAEYRAFASGEETVQATENTSVLISKLKSNDPADTLIVTSIQKLSNIQPDGSRNDHDIDLINNKRLVIIVDEAHRSTFGDMMAAIKRTFAGALFFGFTGTPITDKNKKGTSTTADLFGNELHRYSIADGIRDHNVLGFNLEPVCTFKDSDLRTAVALDKAHAHTVDEAMRNERKSKIYTHYMTKVPMAGRCVTCENGEQKYQQGIEDLLPACQYDTDGHRAAVVADLLDNWQRLSCRGKFHALLATSSIPEAIAYYRLLRQQGPGLKVAALFDQSSDNDDGTIAKEDAMVEMLGDYNSFFGQHFGLPTYASYKRDVAARLAHKRPYTAIDKQPERQLNLLIVVNQMLTGYDSKWINTLYLDKQLEYENAIQAISRTNRLFNPIEKPFGNIRYYRRPYTMKRDLYEAIATYSGGDPFAVFVPKLEDNLKCMNDRFFSIRHLFRSAGVPDMERLPDSEADRSQFARYMGQLNRYLEAAFIQGFEWSRLTYTFVHDDGPDTEVTLEMNQQTYAVLMARYNELVRPGGGGGVGGEAPYDIENHLNEQAGEQVDNYYMNEHFKKYMRLLKDGAELEQTQALQELHRSFAILSQEEQKYAQLFLGEVQRGEVEVDPDKSLSDYIAEYMQRACDDRIHRFATSLGLDEALLRRLCMQHPTADNINEFGRFDALKATVDLAKVRAYLEQHEGQPVPPHKVGSKLDKLLRNFVLGE